MNVRTRAVGVVAAAMLVMGGLSGAAFGKTTKTKTTTHKAGQICSVSQSGKTSKTSKGKKLKCELKGTTSRWTLSK